MSHGKLFRALISVVHQQFNRKHNGNNLAEKAILSFEFAQKATFWEWLPGNLSISNYIAAILKKHWLICTLHALEIQVVEFFKQNSYIMV